MTRKPRPKLAVGKIADMLAEVIRQAKNLFRITVGDGRTTEGLVRDGRYDYANSYIISQNFPMRSRKPGVKEVVLLEFDRDVTSEEAIAEATRQGLERPTYEDALYFGIQYPDVQRERLVVFLHEPWRDPNGYLFVVCLWRRIGRRGLDLRWFGLRWGRGSRFAFVRK